MRAVGFRLLVELRTRWRSLLFLTLVVAVAGGSMLLGVLGARRTASVVTRLQHESRATQVAATPVDDVDLDRWKVIERLPQVEHAETAIGAGVVEVVDGAIDPRWYNALVVVADGPGYLVEQDRPKLLEGRPYDPTVPGEAVINRQAADLLDLHVGDTRPVMWLRFTGDSAPDPSVGVPGQIIVTGIVRPIDDALRDPDDPQLTPTIVFSPASRHPELGIPYFGTSFRLRRGSADVPAFIAAAHEALPDVGFTTQESSLAAARRNRSLRPYVLALLAFAVTAGGVGLALAVQAVARQERADAVGRETMWALGSTRRQLIVLGAARAGMVGLAGAVLAVIGAVALSPLTPLRSARLIEPDPGVLFDPLLLLLALAIVLGLVATGAVVAAGAAGTLDARSRDAGPARVPRFARAAPGAATAAGLNFAFDRGRGGRRTSLYSSLAGIALGVAVTVAAVVYGASLGRFATTPARYGWTWDTELAVLGADEATAAHAFEALRSDPAVRSLIVGNYGVIVSNRVTVPVIGVGDGTVPVGLTLLSGREPTKPDEVVLGEKTLGQLHARVGDPIALDGSGTLLLVVGTAVFAPFAPYPLSEPTELGTGGMMIRPGLATLGQDGEVGSSYALIRFTPGRSLAAQDIIDRYFGGDSFAVDVLRLHRPTTVRGFYELRVAPYVFGGVVAVIALATMAHYLLTSAQRRRRDLAVLRALGLPPARIRGVLGVQALVVTTIALIVAIPSGLVAGRFLWQVTARWLDVGDDVSAPALGVAGIAVVTLGAAGLISLVASTRAARVSPAAALASE